MRSFALALAWREGRSSWRRIGLYMGSIALGVAALVAINSFRGSAVQAVRSEAQALLGADIRLQSSRPFPEPVQALLDSLASAGVPVAYDTRLASMVLAERSGRTRLLQVRAVAGGFPFYGRVETDPPGRWPLEPGAARALVDPAVLVQLGAAVGDTLAIGEARFAIAGTMTDRTGGVGIQSAIGPRVYIPRAMLEATELVRVGSLVQYQAYLELEGGRGVARFLEAHQALLEEQLIDIDTAEEQVERLTESLGSLGRFLGLVGLMALLLGGVGVASAVHVFVKEKLPTIAVLRCLGATQRTVFAAYLLQTGALGLAGAMVGVLGGVAAQALLPRIAGSLLPVEVGFAIQWPAVLGGLAVGAWVATIFALLPLLAVRDVAPLQALRRDFEPPPRRDRWRFLAYAALGGSVLGLALWQAPEPDVGLGFAAGIAGTLALLWGAAFFLSRATRRWFPRRAGYVVRQGIANLFRPRNQTVSITLALGFGVFLLATLYLVQRNLLDRLRLDADPARPNLLFFDVQPDQADALAALAAARGASLRQLTPIVPARIAAVEGRPVEAIIADTTSAGPRRWTLRREYRNTYRDSLVETELLVAGEWWGAPGAAGDVPRISVEEELADDLGVGIGDRITWDVQGVPIETEVASLRRVEWARFAPNFFVVFEPGVLERAPQSLIALARVADPTRRAELQRDLVQAFPNVSILDLTLVQDAVDGIIGQAALVIRFLALFGIAGGVLVLVGALATSRFQRVRESALLRTLGGRRRQVRTILLTEYLALGILAGLAGMLPACIAAWALVTRFFELEFRLPGPALLAAWGGVALLTVLVGALNSRDALGRTPLAVLREAGE